MSDKTNNEELALIKPSELSKVDDNMLNAFQLKALLKKTPKAYIKKRPAKGGGQWEFVSGGYVKKMLNIMFGWDWDFELKSREVMFGQVIVEGKLTVRSNGKTVIKEQFGKKEVVFKKGTKDPLDIGNDFKAAATDALKKCAAELGIAADIYNKAEFREVSIDVSQELTFQEKKDIEERNRLKAVISASKSLNDLDKALSHIKEDDEEMMKLYDEKRKELKDDK